MNEHRPLMLSASTKRRFWTTLLACITVLVGCAVIDIAVPRLGSFAANVVATVSLLAGVAILLMAGFVVARQNGARIPAALGMVAAVAALLSSLLVIWPVTMFFNPSLRRSSDDVYLVIGISWILAIAFPISGSLSYTRLPGRWICVRYLTLLLVWSLVIDLFYWMVDENTDWMWRESMSRITTVLSLGALFGILASLVLHFRFRIKFVVPSPVPATSVLMTCPACALQQSLTVGDSTCAQCRLRFHIEIEAPTCPGCGYLCFQLTSDRCPECGASVTAATDLR